MRRPSTPTLLITGHGERELAVAALRGGAHDLIQKPIDRDYFVASLERAIQLRALDRQVAEQRQALQRHAEVLEHVGDGVFLVDENGVVQLWNPAVAAITGLPEGACVGRPAEECIPGWTAIAPLFHLASSPSDPDRLFEAFPVELNGRELWLSVSGVRFGDGAVYAFRDLTAERAVDDLKREFLATASHELRTPLAAIYGAAMTLRRKDVALEGGDRERLLAIVANEARNRRRSAGRREALALRAAAQAPSGGAAPSPEGQAVAADERRRLLDLVEALPEDQRLVVALRTFLDLSEQETAAVLGVRPGSRVGDDVAGPERRAGGRSQDRGGRR